LAGGGSPLDNDSGKDNDDDDPSYSMSNKGDDDNDDEEFDDEELSTKNDDIVIPEQSTKNDDEDDVVTQGQFNKDNHLANPGVNPPTDNSGGANWNEDNYSKDGFWNKTGYNLDEHEFRGKSLWKTPAACMDSTQRGLLKKCVNTMRKAFSRYSQRPGQGWAANEFLLIQITDINGVGNKRTASRRNKTAVMAYGRTNAVEMYNRWLNSTSDRNDNYVHHSTDNIESLEKFWKTNEEDFAASGAIATTADSPTLKEDGSLSPSSNSTQGRTQVVSNTTRLDSTQAGTPTTNQNESQTNKTTPISSLFRKIIGRFGTTTDSTPPPGGSSTSPE